jgi:hypothetical protein
MEFQAKLFNWQDTGNHLIVLVQGAIDGPAFARLFCKIRAETQSLSECKVLVDFADSTCQIDSEQIETLVAGLPLDTWPEGNRLAFVAAPETSSYQNLYFLRTALAKRGLVVGVFRNSIVAIDWLAGLI